MDEDKEDVVGVDCGVATFWGRVRGGPLAHAFGGCEKAGRLAIFVVADCAMADMYAGLIMLLVTRRGCG